MKRRTSSRGGAEDAMPTRMGHGTGFLNMPCARAAPGSARKLPLEQLVQLRGVRLALCRLHDLPDEEAEELVLARTVLGELARILRHHLLDGALDRAGIGDLLEPFR